MTDTPLCSVSRNTGTAGVASGTKVVGQLSGDSLVAAALAIREADAELKRFDAPPLMSNPETTVAAPEGPANAQ